MTEQVYRYRNPSGNADHCKHERAPLARLDQADKMEDIISLENAWPTVNTRSDLADRL